MGSKDFSDMEAELCESMNQVDFDFDFDFDE